MNSAASNNQQKHLSQVLEKDLNKKIRIAIGNLHNEPWHMNQVLEVLHHLFNLCYIYNLPFTRMFPVLEQSRIGIDNAQVDSVMIHCHNILTMPRSENTDRWKRKPISDDTEEALGTDFNKRLNVTN